MRCGQGGDDRTFYVVGINVGFSGSGAVEVTVFSVDGRGFLSFHDCCLTGCCCFVVNVKVVLVGCVGFSGPGHSDG